MNTESGTVSTMINRTFVENISLNGPARAAVTSTAAKNHVVSDHKMIVMRTWLFIFVVFILITCTGIACHYSGSSSRKTNKNSVILGKPVLLGRLEDRSIDESSGIVASRRNPGLYWTHNDSGDAPLIFAFDRAGRSRGVWSVSGAAAYDWEDIAYGPGPERERPYLYIGDIGDNKYSREEIVIYRLLEPVVEMDNAGSDRKNLHQTGLAEAIRLKYPDGPHDAEALLVHPFTADIYIVTKETDSGVYKLNAYPSLSQVNLMVRIADLQIPKVFNNLITGGDISPEGRRVALSDYAQGYELRVPDSSNIVFDSIWRQEPIVIPLGKRHQGDSVCYRLDGLALLATSEGSPAVLYEVLIPDLFPP